MIVEILVFPNSKNQKIIEGNPLKVYLKSPPRNNEANKELIYLLEKYFGRKVKIIKGFKNRKKLIKILD